MSISIPNTKPKKWVPYIILTLVLVLFALITGGILKMKSRFRASDTMAILVAYSRACTNYYVTYGKWPKSLEDLFINKSNILFIVTASPKVDAWGNIMEYVPYDPTKGFASIKSLGSDCKPGGSGTASDLEVHFSTNGPAILLKSRLPLR